MAIPVTLVFDDNDPSIYNEAYIRMKALNMVGTNACITGTVGNNGLYTLAQITEMYNYGWDICNHTDNHVQMTTETDPQIVTAVTNGRTYLINNGFTRSANILVAPSNETNEAILNVVKPYCVMATTRIDNNTDTANEMPLDLLRIRRRGAANNPPATIKDWIDDAIQRGQHLHLNFHKISDNGTALDYPPTDFQTVIGYLAAKRDSGEINILTMSQLYNIFDTQTRAVNGRRTVPRDTGACLSFDGAGDVVNITDSSSLGFSGVLPVTIAARVTPASTATMRIFSQGSEIILRANGTTKEYEFILNSFTTNDRVIAGSLVPNEEARVVGVFDGTYLMLYVNGTMVERVTPTGTYADVGSTWKIGHDTTEQFTGLIDEVRIFNTAWTPSQVVQWGRTGTVPTTGQVGAWLMNEGSGSSVADSSGNSNTGTIVGAAWSTQKFSTTRSTASSRQGVVDFGNSLFFNGSTSEIVLGSTVTLTGTFTISWWESLRGRPDLRMVIGESSTVTSKVGHSSSKWFVRVVNGGSSDNTVELPQTFVWTHVALTRDSNNKVDLWINGTANRLFSDAAQSGNFVFNRVGSSQATSRFLGFLDKFRAWDIALTTAQIQSLYLYDALPTTLRRLDYQMNEGSGTSVIDSSGNGNTGTSTGTSYSTYVPNAARSVANL
jgi:hypothetical protein